MKLKDLVGATFGRLTVAARAANRGKKVVWLCRCECGNVVSVMGTSLCSGRSRSCGCLHREAITIHGCSGRNGDAKSRSPEYRTWQAMKARCENPRCPRFKDYGGRGISICKRWSDSFKAFRDDMGPRPSAEHSIDRVNNDGNYEPGNCRWATRRQQQQNTRRSKR